MSVKTMHDKEQEVRDAKTFREMRQEIERLRKHDALVRQSMDAADYYGLSPENRYTALAYSALKTKCSLESQLRTMAMNTINVATLKVTL